MALFRVSLLFSSDLLLSFGRTASQKKRDTEERENQSDPKKAIGFLE